MIFTTSLAEPLRVVLSSQRQGCGSGSGYGFPGSESDLREKTSSGSGSGSDLKKKNLTVSDLREKSGSYFYLQKSIDIVCKVQFSKDPDPT